MSITNLPKNYLLKCSIKIYSNKQWIKIKIKLKLPFPVYNIKQREIYFVSNKIFKFQTNVFNKKDR